MNNVEYNLLTLLGDLHDKSVDYSYYLNEASEEQIKVMLKDIINSVFMLHDFIFENIDLDKVE